MSSTRRSFGLVAGVLLLAAACAGPAASPSAAPTPAKTPAPTTAVTPAPTAAATPGQMTHVKLQLQWVTQSQFAGYFAAVDQGFYADEGLEVEILQGAVDIVPQTVVASGQAEFGIAWLPK